LNFTKKNSILNYVLNKLHLNLYSGDFMKETNLSEKRQTVQLGLIKTTKEMFCDDELKIAYSIQGGIFCRLLNSSLSIREVNQIQARLQQWVSADETVEFLGSRDNYLEYNVGGHVIKSIYPATARSSLAEAFRLVPFSSGFIVDFGNIRKEADKPFVYPEKLSETYEKTQIWLSKINMELVSDLNHAISSGRNLELINIAEARQEKEISDIADMILNQRRSLRVVLISGPSSSGKTTFVNRLSTQLRVNGLKPILLSLDDYFLNRDKTPKDKNGNYDFDCLESLDLKYLRKQIKDLIDGKTVQAPVFNFITGRREEKSKTLNW
jgi:uridine kinase